MAAFSLCDWVQEYAQNIYWASAGYQASTVTTENKTDGILPSRGSQSIRDTTIK